MSRNFLSEQAAVLPKYTVQWVGRVASHPPCYHDCLQEHIMNTAKGRGKERKAPTHLFENNHVARVTKNKSGSGQT